MLTASFRYQLRRHPEGGIVLDCSRMAEVVAVRPGDLQVDLQPGVVYAALNRRLRSHGLFFPPSPGGSADVATIGGMVANNASGIYSVRYGGTRDHVRASTAPACGTLTAKAQPQVILSMSQPPSSGPAAEVMPVKFVSPA